MKNSKVTAEKCKIKNGKTEISRKINNTMELTIRHLDEFAIIGKMGSTDESADLVKNLWSQTSSHLQEVYSIASKDKSDRLIGFWGGMSSFKKDLAAWEDNFSKGLYLAGVQAAKDASAPTGWEKWTIPSRDYAVAEVPDLAKYKDTFFSYVYFLLPYNRYQLIGAAFDFNDPKDNKNYIYFPVEKAYPTVHKESTVNKIAPCGCHCAYCFFDKCGGCQSENDFCSFARMQEDRKCPTVRCVNNKKIKGCYECDELENCRLGIFTSENSLKATCLFIREYGLKAFDDVLRKAAEEKLNYSKDFVDCYKGTDKQLEVLKSFYSKILK